MSPVEILLEQHRRHYVPGTFERFREWFAHSGCGDMLDNPFLRGSKEHCVALKLQAPRFSELAGATFANGSNKVWEVCFVSVMGAGATSVEMLFHDFIWSTAHTHPIGDFRYNLGYFTKILAGPRFFAFHGAGSCLLLTAMFQAWALTKAGESIDVFYSHAAHKEFTHVFGVWNEKYFVDPDQKTWALVEKMDEVPSLGYIFQQLGVAGNLVYLSLKDTERRHMFARLTTAYFDDYQLSVSQYMYQRRHDTAELARLFREARTKFCSKFSINASDYAWKNELRRQAQTYGVPSPFFMVRMSDPVSFELPPNGVLRIGVGEDELPLEVNLLAAIFFGRTPASLTIPLSPRFAQRIKVPELPWLLVFDWSGERILVNGREPPLWRSRCGQFRLVGMADLEKTLDLMGGHDEYLLEVEADCATQVKVILPLNAFALAADLLKCTATTGPDCVITGRIAA